MKKIVLLTMLVMSLCVMCKAQTSATFTSHHGDKRYQFKVTQEMLDRTPAWSEGEEYPPLSPGRAFQIASGRLSKLFPDAEKWRKRRIILHAVGDKWVYEIDFIEPLPDGLSVGSIGSFSVVVLMNGETIEPKVTKLKLP